MPRPQFRRPRQVHPDLRRSAIMRWASSTTDGTFATALGGAVLFSPTEGSTPLAIAGAFAILLLPYSLIGPFAAGFLDRWNRRRLLMLTGVLRAVTASVAALLAGGGALTSSRGTSALFVLALVVTGSSRFSAAAMAASLPRVVHGAPLAATNSILTTGSAVTTSLGAGLATLVLIVTGTDAFATALALGAAAALAVVTTVAAGSFAPEVLGPDHGSDGSVEDLAVTTANGLVRGVRAAAAAPRVGSGLAGVAAHRWAFGLNTLGLVLVMRQWTGTVPPPDLAGFAVIMVMVTSGMFLAAVATPVLLERWALSRVIAQMLGILAVTQVIVGVVILPHHPPWLVPVGLVLGFCGQVVKLATDAAIMRDITDDRRGQVFTAQDVIFNGVFVLGVTVAALGAPPVIADGAAVPAWLLGGAAVPYLIAASITSRAHRRYTASLTR